jgi:hypothetical protein
MSPVTRVEDLFVALQRDRVLKTGRNRGFRARRLTQSAQRGKVEWNSKFCSKRFGANDMSEIAESVLVCASTLTFHIQLGLVESKVAEYRLQPLPGES